MEVNFFFQESFFSVIQAKVVQFFTYWKQKNFFRKDQKKNFKCLYDGKKRFLEIFFYFHKHVLLDDVFFFAWRG